MDAESFKALSPDHQSAYREYERMFGSQGWKMLMEDVEQQITVLREMGEQARSFDEHQRIMGKLDVLRQLLSYEQQIEAAFENIANMDADVFGEEDEEQFELDTSWTE